MGSNPWLRHHYIFLLKNKSMAIHFESQFLALFDKHSLYLIELGLFVCDRVHAYSQKYTNFLWIPYSREQ
jgi:hypothetical protein